MKLTAKCPVGTPGRLRKCILWKSGQRRQSGLRSGLTSTRCPLTCQPIIDFCVFEIRRRCAAFSCSNFHETIKKNHGRRLRVFASIAQRTTAADNAASRRKMLAAALCPSKEGSLASAHTSATAGISGIRSKVRVDHMKHFMGLH